MSDYCKNCGKHTSVGAIGNDLCSACRKSPLYSRFLVRGRIRDFPDQADGHAEHVSEFAQEPVSDFTIAEAVRWLGDGYSVYFGYSEVVVNNYFTEQQWKALYVDHNKNEAATFCAAVAAARATIEAERA